ncbi:MAG: CoA-binding protein [Elusimicrobiales bacterium]|nr:CoA-binding protein [Elusimicrobiales bacterium]
MNPKEYKLIAVVGVSDDASKYGHKIFRDLLNAGYPVKGVNPKGGFVLGQNVYKSVADIEQRPDLVITVVPPPVTEAVVEECNKLGVKNIWMQPGSDSDLAVQKAREYGIKTTQACFMVLKGVW